MTLEKIINGKLPSKIDKKTREFIKQAFYHAKDQMDEQEFKYIKNKISHKLEITKSDKISWVSELSSYFAALYEAFERDQKKSLEAKRLMGAALFYFINPFDIISDDTPEIGYLDDFFVLVTCLKSLSEDDKKIVERYFMKSII